MWIRQTSPVKWAAAALVLVASAVMSSSRLSADTYPRQPGIDAQHYVFRLSLLESTSNEITGEATVTLKVTESGLKEAWLDLVSATADGKGMVVTSVTHDGAPARFTHADNRLHLPLPAGVKAGDVVVFTIAYHGIPANGLRLIDNIHGDRCAFSENWYNRARNWLPMIDHPADKASGELIVTTRADYQVIVRYGDVVRGVPLSYWAFPQDADKGLAALERDARGSFEFFSDRIGPFAYDKLAHVEAAGMGGGTEHVSNIFYGEKGVTAGNAPVVHETAHQWFGDAVTENDWNDVWLSEGFATYFTLLYTEFASGRDAFADGLRRSRDTVLRLEKSLPNTPVVHRNLDEATVSPNNSLVYQKGAWTLHMLRNEIGTDAFWRGIRLYYSRHMNGLASTADLRAAMEQVSGKQLDWLFAQWLTRSGVPDVSGSWRYDAATKSIVVTVRQTQGGEPYKLTVDVGVVTTAGGVPVVRTVELDAREATVTIPADAEPASVVLDPNVRLLATFGTFERLTR